MKNMKKKMKKICKMKNIFKLLKMELKKQKKLQLNKFKKLMKKQDILIQILK